MKKLIAAIVIASMGAAFADAPTIVYDYKASIKRLDLQVKYVKKSQLASQSFKVVSDTIQGYVTLPLCDNCLAPELEGISRTDLNDEYIGYAYLTLKGNKLAKVVDRIVLKTPVYAGAAVFGSEQYTSAYESSDPIDPKKNTKAWMGLDYVMPAIGAIEPDFDLSAAMGLGPDPDDLVSVGFLGLAHKGNAGIYVQNTGFGTAKVVTTKTPSAASLCGGYVSGKEFNCTIVNTISGTLVGYPWYKGACGRTPMWDLCVETNADGSISYIDSAEDSVISGTWNLKYNNKLSEIAPEYQEAAILDKLKVSILSMYEIDEEGALVD